MPSTEIDYGASDQIPRVTRYESANEALQRVIFETQIFHADFWVVSVVLGSKLAPDRFNIVISISQRNMEVRTDGNEKKNGLTENWPTLANFQNRTKLWKVAFTFSTSVIPAKTSFGLKKLELCKEPLSQLFRLGLCIWNKKLKPRSFVGSNSMKILIDYACILTVAGVKAKGPREEGIDGFGNFEHWRPETR